MLQSKESKFSHKVLNRLHLLNGREASMAMGRCQERRKASTEDDAKTWFLNSHVENELWRSNIKWK